MNDQPDESAEEPELPATLFVDQLEGDGDGDSDGDSDEPRRNALPRRMESWRTRSASGAVMSAMAMGLRQVFGAEQQKPAIIAEAPSDPYDEDDPIVIDYVADDATGTTVILRPWLLPSAADAAAGDDEA